MHDANNEWLYGVMAYSYSLIKKTFRTQHFQKIQHPNCFRISNIHCLTGFLPVFYFYPNIDVPTRRRQRRYQERERKMKSAIASCFDLFVPDRVPFIFLYIDFSPFSVCSLVRRTCYILWLSCSTYGSRHFNGFLLSLYLVLFCSIFYLLTVLLPESDASLKCCISYLSFQNTTVVRLDKGWLK